MTSIKKLTARGFKSFANKTELLFGDKFSVVLGPNGAGKSNVVDSISFVLGKSSAKEMRAEKSANLIFNGGKKGSPAKEAEVTIEFDNSNKVFPIESKDVAISRMVKRNGTSLYKINGEIRTRQQVVDLLNAAKINPDGHNIIMQGDVIGFMEMKPIQRREIIDEIAGISAYEEKKNKCMGELDKVQSRLNEAEIILTEREVNIRELKKERDQAIKYKGIQEEIKDMKATHLHHQIKEKTEKVAEVESKIDETQKKIEKTSEYTKELKDKITEWKAKIKEINNEVEEKGEKEQLILRKEIEDLKTNIVKINSRSEVCETELEKINQRKKQLEDNTAELNTKIKELYKDKELRINEIKKIEQEEKKIDNELNNSKERYGIGSNFNKELENIENEIDALVDSITHIQNKKQDTTRSKDHYDFRLKAIEEKLNSLSSSKDKINLKELKENKLTLKEISNNLNNLLNEDSSYSLQTHRSRSELKEINDELNKLLTRQLSIKEKSLSDLATRKILELKDDIKGIHGTVSSLGKVNEKYSIALEVAAGSRINSIVVENDSIAQKCIEHLKQNKLGTAIFLPLNKIKERAVDASIKELLNDKTIHGLATDLIEYDNKYKNVFSYVFGSTLVVEDLTNARKIGIGRARMVTIDGDLLEPSGAMIGGFRSKRQGLGFKEKEIEENITTLEKESKRLQTLIDHIEQKKTENEPRIIDLRSKKANLEADVIKIERLLNIEGFNTDSIIETKKELNEGTNVLTKELDLLEKDIQLKNKKLEELKNKKSNLREKVSSPEITKSISDLENKKLKIRENILDVNGIIKNIDSQVTSLLLPEKERTEKIIKQQEKEHESFLKEINDLKEILKNRNPELKGKEQQEKKFHSNLKDLISERNKITDKIQIRERSIAVEEERIRSFEQRNNNISIERARFVAELEGLNKEFEDYKDARIKRGIPIEELKIKIKENEKILINIGNVNLRALEVYEELERDYQSIFEKTSKIKVEKEDVLNMMQTIEESKKEVFMKTYNEVIGNFKNIFKSLNTKGELHVELENSENPFEGGLDIQIKMAGNKYLDIKSLSGGEKTLAALSFIFAIQEHSPSPFYLLDEVDAALDKRNSETLSNLIKKYSSKAQYIVISHNDNIIHEADYIYGVSMQDGVSKVVSLKL